MPKFFWIGLWCLGWFLPMVVSAQEYVSEPTGKTVDLERAGVDQEETPLMIEASPLLTETASASTMEVTQAASSTTEAMAPNKTNAEPVQGEGYQQVNAKTPEANQKKLLIFAGSVMIFLTIIIFAHSKTEPEEKT